MRFRLLLTLSVLAVQPVALGDFTGADAFWSDNFAFAMPLVDNGDMTLEGGDVIQIGYFAGVDPNKDPADYTQADWDSFTPLTGDGSPNAAFFPTTIDSSFPGYFNISAQFNTDVHSGVPNSDVRIGIRFFDAPSVAGANNINTVTSGTATWIMKMPAGENMVPFPATADMDAAELEGSLVWEGTPFETDLVPGGVSPAIILTGVAQTGPTSLEISWSGGDGSNAIQTSTDGQNFSTVTTADQTSPATITIDPSGVPVLLVRVIEP